MRTGMIARDGYESEALSFHALPTSVCNACGTKLYHDQPCGWCGASAGDESILGAMMVGAL